jgi:hypothetical protein
MIGLAFKRCSRMKIKCQYIPHSEIIFVGLYMDNGELIDGKWRKYDKSKMNAAGEPIEVLEYLDKVNEVFNEN